ncbi:MAG: CoA transferase [Chloroflexota bacterium]|nr:CoA transferase [Chloroflexota bacterium]
MVGGALSHIKVLDFTTHVAGPYCTKLLADYGADVIKVERPGVGDSARGMGPFPGDIPHPEKSGLFLHLNTNKRSITLDLKSSAGKKIAIGLSMDADLIVENFRPGVMGRLGLGLEALQALNPKLVMTSISNFGQSGPYRDYKSSDLLVYGMGGEMNSTGLDDREPIKLGANIVLYQAGSVAAVGSAGALFLSQDDGTGQLVDVSIMETQVGSIDRRMSALIAYQYTGENSVRAPLGASGYPIGVYPCKDGYLEVTGGLIYLPRVVQMLGDPPELLHPRWYQPESQTDPELKGEFEAHFLSWTLQHGKREAWRIAQESGVLSGPLNTMEDLSNDKHFNARGAFAQVDHPATGSLKYPGRPFVMSESPWDVRRPAPLLGQHNQEILEELGYGSSDVARLRTQGVI